MKKQFSNLIKTHPQLRWKVIDLAVNDQTAGELRIVPVGPKYAIQLVVWDTHWNQLPIIAADLYKHYAGADEAGYATSEAATAAAVDILKAHGWEEYNSEAGETLGEYALILLMILGAVIVLFSLVGVNIVHIMVMIWNFFFWR